MITAMSLTNGTLTLVLNGGSEILTARNDHPKWTEIVDAFKAGNEAVLRSLISLKAVMEDYTVGLLSVNSTGVTYAGRPMHGVDSDRVLAFLRDGLPFRPIANYMARKLKNPSARAINELYNFLEHKNMPLTPEGMIIAYKGVRSSFYSVMGNTKTVVLQGVTDSEGHILNEIGKTIEIERSSCDDDFRNGCSFGLHAGSLAYARGWGERVILVEIDPADVVSVPSDCSCQKLRCCKYRVIGEYTGPMPDTYTSEFEPRDPEFDTDNSCTCGGTDCPNCGCDCEQCRAMETPGLDAPNGDPAVIGGVALADSLSPNSNELVQAAQDAGVLSDDDDNEEKYLEGMQAGIYDKDRLNSARFLAGDVQGADSPAHAKYIEGYVNGYFEKELL